MTMNNDIITQFLISFNEMAGIAPDTIFSKTRKQHVALTREIAFYVLRQNGIIYRLISEHFEKLGGFYYDHATIYHGWQNITNHLIVYRNDISNLTAGGLKLYDDIVFVHHKNLMMKMENERLQAETNIEHGIGL